MKHLYFILIFNFTSVLTTHAQATFFKTISTSSQTNQSISAGIEFNGHHYFSASKSTSLSFSTMWKTNGTSSGTIDFINSDNVYDAAPIFVFNSELYYLINDQNVKKIFKTNGITNTSFLEPIAEAPEVSFDKRTVAIINNNFIFSYGNTITGQELYISDGTPTNTPILLKDINSGTNSSNPIYFTKIDNNKIVFRADDGINGRELWVTDGTSAGTQLIKNINPTGSSSINKLTSFNGKAYFSLGNDIWETDGTEIGTKIFLNLRSNDNSEDPFYEYNGVLYFTAFDATFNKIDLWKTDGTIIGSSILTSGLNYADVFQKTNNLLFFAASDDAHGYELWRTNGTPTGTFLTRDINVGPDDSLVSNPSLGNGGDKLFFEATFYDNDDSIEDQFSNELWASNGTEIGTLLDTTIDPSSGGGKPDDFFNINGKLIFKANADADNNGTNRGINLWVANANLLTVDDNENKENTISIYPNPTKSTFHFKGNTSILQTATLFSIDGRKIKTINNPIAGVSISELNYGTYLLTLTFNNGSKQTEKIIKI